MSMPKRASKSIPKKYKRQPLAVSTEANVAQEVQVIPQLRAAQTAIYILPFRMVIYNAQSPGKYWGFKNWA